MVEKVIELDGATKDARPKQPSEVDLFGVEYDKLARLNGEPLWNEFSEGQRLAFVAAGKRCFVERDRATDSYLTFQDVARLVKISVSTVGREVVEGRLPVVEVRGCRRVRRSALEAYLDQGNARMRAQ